MRPTADDRADRAESRSLALVCQFVGFGLLLSLASIFGSTAVAMAIAVGLAAALTIFVAFGLGFALAAAASGEPSGPPHSSSPW
jgi:hypothetical protein